MENDDELLKTYARMCRLENALAYAIKEADGWCEESRGNPVDTPEMDEARKLLQDAEAFNLTATKLVAYNSVYWEDFHKRHGNLGDTLRIRFPNN